LSQNLKELIRIQKNVLNKKPIAEAAFLVAFTVFLLLAPLVAQTCSAQPTQTQQDKAMSFLRDVIQLDVDHYKFTLDYNNTDHLLNIIYFEYKVEPKTLAFWKSYKMIFEFRNDTLTGFSVPGDGNNLAYTRSHTDRFNEVIGILERYQTWNNDSQVGDFINLMNQVGSERSLLQASGNISLTIQMYSDEAEYRFSNYINGVEYTSIIIGEGNRTGRVGFSDNRASLKIGNTTIGVSQDQAVAIAQNYVNSHPVRGTVPNSNGITDLTVTGIKGVYLKSQQKENDTLYPYYDVEFNVQQSSSGQLGYSVNVGANDGEVWGGFSYSSSTNSTIVPAFSLIILLVIVAAVIVVVVVLITRRKPVRTAPPVIK
jgi:hypothetical protein